VVVERAGAEGGVALAYGGVWERIESERRVVATIFRDEAVPEIEYDNIEERSGAASRVALEVAARRVTTAGRHGGARRVRGTDRGLSPTRRGGQQHDQASNEG